LGGGAVLPQIRLSGPAGFQGRLLQRHPGRTRLRPAGRRFPVPGRHPARRPGAGPAQTGGRHPPPLASTLDPAAFDRAAAMLGGAGSIELCAAGSGLYLLEEFAFRLMKFGFRVNVISNSVNLSYIANQMDPTHCLLLLSY